jgi:hypothetical protein
VVRVRSGRQGRRLRALTTRPTKRPGRSRRPGLCVIMTCRARGNGAAADCPMSRGLCLALGHAELTGGTALTLSGQVWVRPSPPNSRRLPLASAKVTHVRPHDVGFESRLAPGGPGAAPVVMADGTGIRTRVCIAHQHAAVSVTTRRSMLTGFATRCYDDALSYAPRRSGD